MTMTGYLSALNGRYDHLRGADFDWSAPDHLVRVVLAYLIACQRRTGADIPADVRALATQAGVAVGDAAPLTMDGWARLQEQLLFLHQTTSPVARLLAEPGALDAVPADARRALLDREVAAIDGFLGELQALLDQREESAANGVAAGAGQLVVADAADVQRLAAACEALAGLTVTAVASIHGGMSKTTNRCTLTAPDGAVTEVIMRSDTTAGYSTSSVRDEFGILERLHASGVAVPRPLASGQLASGAAAILVSREPGAMFGTPFHSMIRSESLCRAMGAHLASIHRVDTTGMTLAGAGQDPKAGVAADIAFIEANWRRIGKPDIVVECALDWLKANLDLASGPASLVHGDYGVHNLLQENGVIHAVLDWEFAKIGNQIEDLGFVLPVAEMVHGWDAFLDGYVEAGGTRPGDDQLNFFNILGRTRLAIMISQTHDIFRRHGHFTAGVPGAFLQPRLLADLGKLILAQDKTP